MSANLSDSSNDDANPPGDDLLKLVAEWPYAREFVLGTMDQNLIQRHGELLLCRSLNIGRTVAFIGAGVSMSYGRISWRNLVRAAVDIAVTAYKEKRDSYNGEKSGNAVSKSKDAFKDDYPRISDVYEILEKLRPGDTDAAWRGIDPNRMLVFFQVADELGEALNRLNTDGLQRLNPVRRELHQFVFDDAGHAFRLVENARGEDLKESSKADDSKKWKEGDIFSLERFADRPLSRQLKLGRRSFHSLFTEERLCTLAEKIRTDFPSLANLCDAFKSDRESGPSTLGHAFLNPTHRFVAAALLSVLDDETREVIVKELLPKEKGADTSDRRPIEIDSTRDPLKLLVDGLGVRRFITTNYDLEIEKLALDRGYALPPTENRDPARDAAVVESVNTMQGRARDFVLKPERAAHLIDFAVQDGRFDLDLVHLHGRATETESIVATEADYQELYLKDEKHRDLLDGAVNLAFRGNALLFVGNGMGEDDLLRPLRHFMSEGPNGRESVAVALLPDLKGERDRLEEKVWLLRRYGVYAVHYGQGKVSATGEVEFILSDLVRVVRYLGARVSDIARKEFKPISASDALKHFEENVDKDNTAEKKAIRLVSKDETNETLKIRSFTEIENGAAIVIKGEVSTIDYLLDFCIRAAQLPLDKRMKELAPARLLAENLEDALIAGFLSAHLGRLQGEWANWRSVWFGDIPPRLPKADAISINETVNAAISIIADDDVRKTESERLRRYTEARLGFMLDRRRPIKLRDYDGVADNETDDRRFRVEWSQTFAQACAEVRRHAESRREDSNDEIGRRVFILAGPRGVGKGHFFSALTESTNLLKFLDASWSGDAKSKPQPYVGAFAFNFSFSIELGSGFDRLAKFLCECLDRWYKHEGLTKAREELENRYKEFVAKKPLHSGSRIGALEFLFKVLADKFRSELPPPKARFALFINATHILFSPRGFAKSSDVTRLFSIFLDKAYENAPIDIVLVTDEKGVPVEFRNRKFLKHGEGTPLAFESPPKAWSVDVIRLSPEWSLEDEAAVRRIGLRESGSDESDCIDGRAVFLRLRPAMLGIVASAAFPQVVAAIAAGCPRDPSISLQPERELKEAVAEIKKILKNNGPGVVPRMKYAKAIAGVYVDQKFLRSPEYDKKIEDYADKIDEEFGRYFKAFGGSRFALTIAFAAADEAIESCGRPEEAVNTLNAIRDEVSGIDDPSRENAIVRAVIEIHRRRGIRPEAYPKIKLLQGKEVRKDEELLRELSEACENALVTLSMIGHPTELDCVAAVQHHVFAKRKGHRSQESDKSITSAALDILVKRCLVFRFGRSGAKAASVERFGVHRYIQRHVFRQLEQPLVEHAEIETYMPTLYASQPNDLPCPTAAAHARIREVAALLSRYPSRHRLRERDTGRNYDAKLQCRMLRAAYGMIRTTYSVGVVARFNEYGDKVQPPAVGHFEEHRHQVRWLLKRAKDLAPQILENSDESERASDRPFYSGDIAWLYNECGVLSLVQGRLDDAGKLFAEGIRALAPIERRGTPGALTAVIRLNRSLVDIERGNLRKADAALRDIVAQQDEHRAVRWIAYGYRGLIDHVRGNLNAGDAKYDGAINILTQMGRNRAASIFSRHRADLHRRIGNTNLNLAERYANEAVNFAAAGSHADVLHQARLSRLQILAQKRGADAYTQLHREMAPIVAYATVMGMPRLEVETAYVDAFFRKSMGDLGMAMKVINKSLAIANDCDLVLRKIGGMLLAADISFDLGMKEGAKTLAETAKAMAISAEYSAAQDKAQTLLAKL